MHNKNNIDYYKLISQYLAGELTSENKALFFKLLKENNDFSELYDHLAIIWTSNNKEHFDTDTAWRKLSGKLEFNQVSKKAKIYKHIAIAATIAIFGILSTIFIINSKHTLDYTTVTAQTNILEQTLSDGTNITLNQNSTLVFPNNFNTDSIRKVKLEGEAYFEVKSDTNKTFIVETEHAYIKVLGTKFNLNAHSNNNLVELIVTEGKVQISDKSNELSQIIIAGESCIYNNIDNSFRIIETDPNSLFWKTQTLTFRNNTLSEVCSVLENAYNYKFEIADSSCKNIMFTSSFTNAGINEVLEILSLSLGISYTKNNDTIRLIKP